MLLNSDDLDRIRARGAAVLFRRAHATEVEEDYGREAREALVAADECAVPRDGVALCSRLVMEVRVRFDPEGDGARSRADGVEEPEVAYLADTKAPSQVQELVATAFIDGCSVGGSVLRFDHR